MLDGAEEGDINALAISKYIYIKYLILSSGDHFVSGGGDKVLKLWGYDDGMCYYTGIGHSGAIIKVK